MIGQKPYRPFAGAFQTFRQILIAMGAQQHSMVMLRQDPVHDFIDHSPALFIIQCPPIQSFLRNLCGKSLNGLMKQFSDVRRFHCILFPFSGPQAVFDKMGKRTMDILLQPGHAGPNREGIQSRCLIPAKRCLLISVKQCLFQILSSLFPGRMPEIPIIDQPPQIRFRLAVCKAPHMAHHMGKGALWGNNPHQRFCVHMPVSRDLQPRKQLFQPIHQNGRTKCPAFRVGNGIADRQEVGGLAECRVDAESFLRRKQLGASAQVHSHTAKHVPFLCRQKAFLLPSGRQDPVIAANNEQCPDILALGPANIPHQNLIQRRRNHANFQRGKSGFQNTIKSLRRNLLIPQNLHQLIQSLHDNVPDLGVLIDLIQLSHFPEFPDPFPQLLLQMNLRQILIQGLYHAFHRTAPFQAFLQQETGGNKPLPAVIQCRKGFIRFPIDKGLLPSFAPDPEFQTVILQLLRLIGGQAAESGLQQFKNVIVPVAAPYHMQNGQDQIHDRILHHRPFFIQKKGNVIFRENPFDDTAIGFHITGNNGHFVVTPAFLPGKGDDPGCQIFHFGFRIVAGKCFNMMYCIRPGPIRVMVKLPLQMTDLRSPRGPERSSSGTGKMSETFLFVQFLCHPAHFLKGEGMNAENILIPAGVIQTNSKGNRQIPGQDRQLFHHPDGLRRIIVKTVHPDPRTGKKRGLIHPFNQGIHRIL